MGLTLRSELLQLRYRAARSHYTLVPFDRLSNAHQDLLRAFRQEPDFFGILSPSVAGLDIRAVSRATAALFENLEEPGSPAKVSIFDPRHLAGLVLDGVLEVESNGVFCSGAPAHPVLIARSITLAHDELGRLSSAALRYAEATTDPDPISLSERLYRFNTVPATPEWRRRLPSYKSVREFLDLDGSSRLLLQLDAAGLSFDSTGPWLSWQRSGSPDVTGYKLYISPLARHLPEALRAVAALAGEIDLDSLKVGSDVYGVLRPDKFVLYFSQEGSMRAAADRLAAELEGMPAQGVPFTAQLSHKGLLSWGADPDDAPAMGGARASESWRSWIVKRLAGALRSARRSSSAAVAPSQFAVDRLALEGVDPVTWSPQRGFSASLDSN